jgi:hypothetical protein
LADLESRLKILRIRNFMTGFGSMGLNNGLHLFFIKSVRTSVNLIQELEVDSESNVWLVQRLGEDSTRLNLTCFFL